MLCDQKKDYDGAIDCFKETIRLDPGYATAHYNLGVAQGHLGRWGKASSAYAEAVRLKPDDIKYRFNLGHALTQAKQFAEAAALYREVIRLKPDHVDAHLLLARSLLDAGKSAEAIHPCRDAVRLKPDDFNAHHLLGCALVEAGRGAEAVAPCREAVRLKPYDFAARFYLGVAFSDASQYAEAIAEFREALRLKPDLWNAHWQLAWLLATAADPVVRNPAQAVTHAEQAAALRPTPFGVWNALGVARYRAGDWKGALEPLTKGGEFGMTPGSGPFFLAMAHWQLGEKDKAREWYDKAVAWTDSNKPHDDELKRFRAEAAELLGILAPPPRAKGGP